jgi:hypothetical protein
MDRRTYLGVVGVTLLPAGCVGGPSQVTESKTPSTRDTRSCPGTPTDDRTAPPWPAEPSTLSRESVIEYTTQIERAYVIRNTLQEHERAYSVDVDTDAENANATQVDDGWLVTFDVIGPAYKIRTRGSGAHVDPGLYTVTYFVSSDAVIRQQSTGEQVDLRENGARIHCTVD